MSTVAVAARAPARVPSWLLWIAGTAALVVLTWPPSVELPKVGLDPSWVAGLSMAWRDHLDYGSQILFTYGPLGFLDHPALYDTSAYRLAVLYQVPIRTIEAFIVWRAVSVTWGRGWGFLVAWLVLAVTATLEARSVIAIGFAVLLLCDDRMRPRLWWVPLLGLWAGFELLGKQGTGVLVGGVLLIALAFAPEPGPRGRRIALFAAGVVLGFLGGWLASGQTLDGLPPFLWGSVQLLAGYSGAMGVEDPTLRRAYWGAAVVIVAGALGLRAIGRETARAGIAPLALASAFALFLMFKQGFVRMDPGHVTIFFGFALALVSMLPWGPALRTRAALTMALALAVLFGSNGKDPAAVVNPWTSTEDFAQSVRLTYDASERSRLIAESRQEMYDEYAIRRPVFEALQGGGVHAVPWEVGAIWAFGLPWRPLTVFQDYTAYTSWLDDRNTDDLDSVRAPDRILQARATTIDGRLAAWDPPRQSVEILCRYRPVARQSLYRVLWRGPQRCGPPRTIATVEARWGQTVAVPRVARDELLVVEVEGLKVRGLERIRALLFRPRERWVSMGRQLQRVMPDTATDGLLLRAPVGLDPPGPFRRTPQARTLAFWLGMPGTDQHGGDLRLTFRVRRVSGP